MSCKRTALQAQRKYIIISKHKREVQHQNPACCGKEQQALSLGLNVLTRWGTMAQNRWVVSWQSLFPRPLVLTPGPMKNLIYFTWFRGGHFSQQHCKPRLSASCVVATVSNFLSKRHLRPRLNSVGLHSLLEVHC